MATRQSVFEGQKHVRKLSRGRQEYQYKREINPPSLRPIAVKLFGRWTVVRALREMADYHRAALEFDAILSGCQRYIEESKDIRLSYDGPARRMTYQGPIRDPFFSHAILSARTIGAESLFLAGPPKPVQPNTTAMSSEAAIKVWVQGRQRVTKPQAMRNKRSKMEHFYAWLKRQGRTDVPFIIPPASYQSKGGTVDGRIADLSRDDLTRITSAELREYRDHLVKAQGNNYAIDHLSDLKVMTGVAFAEGKFGEDGRDPGAGVTLPGKRERGKRDQFTDDEAQRILDSLPGKPAWIEWPLKIMAYLGLICEEIADATTHDVERVRDLVVLHVRADHRIIGGQTNELKTIQRARSLPLHPDIAEEFWAYAERVRAEHGNGALFPQVHADRDGMRRGKIGRAVRDFIKRLGVEATPYSFRHRFTTQLEGMPDLKPARERYICGHKAADIHDGYKEHPPHQTYPFIARINPAVQK